MALDTRPLAEEALLNIKEFIYMIAKLALFLTAVLWGSTFTIGKIVSEVFPPSVIIASRFLIASIILLIVSYPQRKQLDREYCRCPEDGECLPVIY